MNHHISLKSWLRAILSLAVIAAVLYTASLTNVAAQDTKATDTKTKATEPAKKPVKKKLTGAELYAINCNRCHAERYPTEFTSAQWKTIMIHMRVRANLPAAQAREILKYLQEDSGN
jgi:hypothetical protein